MNVVCFVFPVPTSAVQNSLECKKFFTSAIQEKNEYRHTSDTTLFLFL